MLAYRVTKKKVEKIKKRTPKTSSDESLIQDLWDATHHKYSRVILDTIISVKGFWVKTGQYMSSRADVLPDAFISALARLQDALPSRPMREVHTTLIEDVGDDVDELFTFIDTNPLGSASIAQVHRAKLKSGEDVVIKVQHRGMDGLLAQDLSTLETIMSWIAYFEPEYDFRPLIREWNKEVAKEVDFENEAQNMQEVMEAYHKWNRAAGNIADVPNPPVWATEQRRLIIHATIPEVIPSLVTRRVLVMKYVDGCKITDLDELDAHGVNRAELVEAIFRAYAHQIHISGLVNADPHPGNILVSFASGKAVPVLLDFGLTKRLSEPVRLAFAKLIYACSVMDYHLLMESFEDSGVVLNRKNPEEAMKLMRFFMRSTQSREEEIRDLNKFHREENAKRKADSTVKRRPVEAYPAELIFVFRAFALLRGLSATLNVRISYLKVFKPFAKLALLETASISSRIKSLIYPSPPVTSLDSSLRQLLQRLHHSGALVGIQVCAYKDGVPVVDTCAGTISELDPRPIGPDTLFNCWSVTKAVAATALHVLADRRLVDYDRSVGFYWPEFVYRTRGGDLNRWKEECTVRDMLTHEAGLATAGLEDLSHERLCDWDRMVHAMESAECEMEPGSMTQYHALSFGWLVGGLVEKVLQGKKSFKDFLHDEIAKPLGLQDEMFIGIPEDLPDARLAALVNGYAMESSLLDTAMGSGADPTPATPPPSAEDAAAATAGRESIRRIMMSSNVRDRPWLLDPCYFNDRKIREACIPAANGHFTARALAKFYACLANGGSLGGVRLLSAERVRQVSQPSSLGQEFCLGYQSMPFYEANGSVRRTAFGHAGLGGSFAFCDPAHNVSVAIVVNCLTLQMPATSAVLQHLCTELGLGSLVRVASVTTSLGMSSNSITSVTANGTASS